MTRISSVLDIRRIDSFSVRQAGCLLINLDEVRAHGRDAAAVLITIPGRDGVVLEPENLEFGQLAQVTDLIPVTDLQEAHVGFSGRGDFQTRADVERLCAVLLMHALQSSVRVLSDMGNPLVHHLVVAQEHLFKVSRLTEGRELGNIVDGEGENPQVWEVLWRRREGGLFLVWQRRLWE